MPATKKTTKKPASRKPATPELVWEDGYWWSVKGTKKTNLGRSRRYAQQLMEDL